MRHGISGNTAALSPRYDEDTPLPVSTISPANSCPGIVGKRYVPFVYTRAISEPQMPDARISKRTSPSRGSGFGTSSYRRSPTACKTHAFIAFLPFSPEHTDANRRQILSNPRSRENRYRSVPDAKFQTRATRHPPPHSGALSSPDPGG